MLGMRDANGRPISILNEYVSSDKSAPTPPSRMARPLLQTTRHSLAAISQTTQHHQSQQQQQHHQRRPAGPRATSTSLRTPELLRAGSFDSMRSNEYPSPLTPDAVHGDYGINGTTYGLESQHGPFDGLRKNEVLSRTHSYASSTQMMLDEDEEMEDYNGSAPVSPKHNSSSNGHSMVSSEKRFPCRFRDLHGCEKTFTTSGHASRHSKIHTAEKGVQCTFAGCHKKFTRADNMKQHLETHTKIKSRISGGASSPSHSGSSRPSLCGSKRRSSFTLTKASESRRQSMNSTASATEQPPLSPDSVSGPWNMGELAAPLAARPVTSRVGSSGLDTLAMVAMASEDA